MARLKMLRRLYGLVAAANALLMPVAAHAQRLGGGGELNLSLGRILSALILCLMLAALAALLLKKNGGKLDLAALRAMLVRLPVAQRVTVIETRRVSQHADIALVRCDGHEYLILASAQQQQVLRTVALPAADPEAGT